uniref:FMN-binding split barrel n=2 Tax=Davidia involucrata TaxID=16924 RepID=A0A5B6YK02_DAVIN
MRRINLVKNRVRASAEKHSGSASGPVGQNPKPSRYHPFEDISDSESMEGETRLTPAETTRTIIEVNSKTTLMFSGFIDDEVHENIFWPDLPYVTDEHGNIYFQVKNDEDILQTLTSEDNFVQVIIGLDTTEMISEMELLGRSDIDFGVEEIDDEDSDVDDDDDKDDDDGEEDDEDDNYEKDWVALLEDEYSDETLGDWAKLETMRSSHPMYFAKKLTEVVSDVPIDFMDQPPAGLAIQGLIRPAFIEEHSVIQKHMSNHQSSNADTTQVGKIVNDKVEDIGIINGHIHEPGPSQDSSIWAEELEKDENLRNGTSYYKLEMIKIQLISAHGHQTVVEVEDFRNARPDAIAHSAAKIISRLKAGGEKTTQALKSLCLRCKGIQVEEAALIGIDTLGFDMRVCSGTQVQTLRFAFRKQASSEYSAERQLNDILFPRIPHKMQKKKEAHQTEL